MQKKHFVKQFVLILLILTFPVYVFPQGTRRCCGDNISNNVTLTSTPLGKQDPSISSKNFNEKALSDKTAVVYFEKGNGIYALDKWETVYKEITKIRSEYDKLSDSYYASWKFMPVGTTDKVLARVELEKGNPAKIIPDSILFATKQGLRFEAKAMGDNMYEITVPSGEAKDVIEVYALYPKGKDKADYYTLGKLNVVTYERQVNDLVLVQVDATINSYTLENKLKEVYASVGVEWKIRTEDFKYEGDLSQFMDKKSGLLSAYNDKMNALIAAYKEKNKIDNNTCYVFILNDNGVEQPEGNKRNTAGFMPRGKQFGFVFTKNMKGDELNHTIAHELGHGRWRLQHTFDETFGKKMKEGSTNNLMDYSSGTHLAKWQWEQIVDPAWFTNPLEGDEKGMVSHILQESTTISKPGFEATFYVGNKKYVIEFYEQLKDVSNEKVVTYDNKTYLVVRMVGNNSLAGFYEEKKYLALKNSIDGTVDLATEIAQLILKLKESKNYAIKEVIDLSETTTKLKDALLRDNDFKKVQAIITLSEALDEDEYLGAFKNYDKNEDCRIDLNIQKKYSDECLDHYIKALANALNSDVEYFDESCNCIVKRNENDILGNSDLEFQEWFKGIGGSQAINEVENRIYEANIERYKTNISKGIYGADEFGFVQIPQALKERLREEARKSAFPSLKATWSIMKSDADPNGISFNFNPFSLERIGYYHYRALAVTDREDGEDLLTEVGLQVAIQWVFEVIPAAITAKNNFKGWKTVKIEPGDLITKVEGQSHHIIGADDNYIYLQSKSGHEAKVPYSTRNLDNVEWLEKGTFREATESTLGQTGKTVDNIAAIRKEFDAYGNEWMRENPFTGKEMFNEKSGGYVVCHKQHNVVLKSVDSQIEFEIAESLADEGYKVELLSEKAGKGVKTPDANIKGLGIFDGKNVNSKIPDNITKNVENYLLSPKSRSNVEIIIFNIKGNNVATPNMINDGILNSLRTAENGGLNSNLPKTIGLRYENGNIKLINLNDFRNGTRF